MVKVNFRKNIKQLQEKHPKIIDFMAAALAFMITFAVFFLITRYILSSQLSAG